MKNFTMAVHRYYQRVAVILRHNPGNSIYATWLFFQDYDGTKEFQVLGMKC